jgi:hypothetical protein
MGFPVLAAVGEAEVQGVVGKVGRCAGSFSTDNVAGRRAEFDVKGFACGVFIDRIEQVSHSTQENYIHRKLELFETNVGGRLKNRKDRGKSEKRKVKSEKGGN